MEVQPKRRRIPISTGVSLHVVDSVQRGSVPLVLLPAYADSWWSWSRVLPDLAGERSVLAVDLRGHGDSDRPACCYSVESFAGDVIALCNELDIGRAVFVGHSGSCFVARHLALTHPDRVAGLGLIASPVRLDRGRLRSFVDLIDALPDAVPDEFILDFQSSAAYQPLPEAFLARIVVESRKVPARVWRDTLAGLLDYRDDHALGAIPVPTTLIWGNRDQIVSREDQDTLARSMPNASLVVVPEVGHSPHWERPASVLPLLLELGMAAI